MRELVTPHPEEQRSLAVLREEFREEHTADLRKQMSKHELGWGVIGDPEKSRAHFSGDEWAKEMLARLDAPVTQDFGLDQVPFPQSMKIEDLAQKSLLHESATWEEGTQGTVDHDAPACAPLDSMTDDQVCDYVEMAIQESARG